ncbi:MAG TPA: proline dehydrogenase [bacterium]|nr:proline dehydrogenase [bacterium]
MKWFNRMIVAVLPIFPKSFIWLFSCRYVAGITLKDALSKVETLNREGCRATIDVLGEDIETLEEADRSREESIQVLEAIHSHRLDAGLSVKLTSLGLRIDRDRCFENMRCILQRAKALNVFVRIDMEDATTTDSTLEIYRSLRREFSNAGAVIQSCLKRSETDVHELMKDGIANLRICKGIYNESPEIAFKKRETVRRQYMMLTEMLLRDRCFVGIATHDKKLIDRSLSLIESLQCRKSDYEFQMLLGVTEKMRGVLIDSGHALRVYVPFGRHWYAYSMRRLRENPGMAGHILKNLFIRG